MYQGHKIIDAIHSIFTFFITDSNYFVVLWFSNRMLWDQNNIDKITGVHEMLCVKHHLIIYNNAKC